MMDVYSSAKPRAEADTTEISPSGGPLLLLLVFIVTAARTQTSAPFAQRDRPGTTSG